MTEKIPDFLWFNGTVIPWQDAKVHIWSELAVRGANVFDGIRGFWDPKKKCYSLLSLEKHLERLFQSAQLLKFPEVLSMKEIIQGIIELIQKLDYQEHIYIRPTIYIESGRYGFDPANTKMGAYIVAFPSSHSPSIFSGIRCCVSSWQRSTDLSFSPRIKTGASYLSLRLPRIEGMQRGLDDVILLNHRGTVAEGSGAAIFIFYKGVAFTPPLYADILQSISRENTIYLLRIEFGIEVVEREISRTELYTADEILFCGTLSEIQPVIEIDGYKINTGVPGPLTTMCRNRYLEICDKNQKVPPGWLFEVPFKNSNATQRTGQLV